MEQDVIIRLEHVTKLYGMNKSEAVAMLEKDAAKSEVYKETGVITALWDINLEIKRGEIFVIIGLSGSGKSTLVRCLNRLHKPTSGSVEVNGRDVLAMSKKELRDFRRNDIAMVFQSFGLMSHRNVVDNVAYGLEVRGVSKEERQAKAREMTKMVGLEGMEEQPISSLSGGMKQRVGLARALANDPKVLLMDEPFSALDPLVRREMQFELLSIQRKLGKTVVFITHDINEAFKLGDTVAIMRDGRLVQVDTPEGMSSHPADDYVRQFIDSADKTKVLSAHNVMAAPSCLVRSNESPLNALQEMRSNQTSSAYMVDDKMGLLGIVSLDGAIRANREGLRLDQVLDTDVRRVKENTLLTDIIPVAAETRYPIAVVDDEERLVGIVSKAAVLSSLV